MTDIEEILKRPYPSYHPPLELACEKTRRGGPELADGIALLQGLRQRYRHVLAVGHELVLALLEAGRRDDALTELRLLEEQFQDVNEEMLCRWGRWHKEAGDALVGENNLAVAALEYRKAYDRYDQAYAIRLGHYPGINKAALHLLLAGVTLAQGEADENARHRRQAEELAGALLARRGSWPEDLAEDNIWHPATAGEAHLLRREWAAAEAEYRRALAQQNLLPMHRDSMRKQVRRVLDALARLGVQPEGAFTDPAALFASA